LGLAFLVDDRIDAIMQAQSPSARTLALWLTEAGDWWPVALAGLGLGMFYFRRNRPTKARAVFLATLTGLTTGLVATLLRSIIGRTRPNVDLSQGFFGPWHNGHWTFGNYQFASFPSGHAATLFGIAVAAWWVNRRAGLYVGIFAVLVSWSRVAQSSHHFSDVIASALLAWWLSPWILQKFEEVSRDGFARFERLRLNETSARRMQVPPPQNSRAPQFQNETCVSASSARREDHKMTQTIGSTLRNDSLRHGVDDAKPGFQQHCSPQS
jgi:membrane-associated phospholipid phosphatase